MGLLNRIFGVNNRNSKANHMSKKEDDTIVEAEKALSIIEQAYKIATEYPPEFLKSTIYQSIFVENMAEEPFARNPSYKVAITCTVKYTSDKFMVWMQNENRNKYYPLWHFRDCKLRALGGVSGVSEISMVEDTEGVSWYSLEKKIAILLADRHPNWKISVLDDYMTINYIW